METITINSNEINKDNNSNMSAKFHIEKRKEEIQKILNNIPKVKNMISSSGNEIANQFILTTKDFVLFQSYKSPIALKTDKKTYIFNNWNYSTTTGKYRNDFLGETKKETLKKLKSGEYVAVDFDIKDL